MLGVPAELALLHPIQNALGWHDLGLLCHGCRWKRRVAPFGAVCRMEGLESRRPWKRLYCNILNPLNRLLFGFTTFGNAFLDPRDRQRAIFISNFLPQLKKNVFCKKTFSPASSPRVNSRAAKWRVRLRLRLAHHCGGSASADSTTSKYGRMPMNTTSTAPTSTASPTSSRCVLTFDSRSACAEGQQTAGGGW